MPLAASRSALGLLALCGVVLLLGAWLGAEAQAAPIGSEQGSAVAVGTFANSGTQALAHWTAARKSAARPLPARLLAGRSVAAAEPTLEEGGARASFVPASRPHTAATDLRRGTVATAAAGTSALEGVDSGESTAFPNSANGVVYGEYRTRYGRERYQCSGSVISSSAGNIVLTSGHCVIDPETGTVASYVVFVPGYREGQEPFGEWPAEAYATTAQWAETAGSYETDEAGDMAMLLLEESSGGKTVQSEVGALGIAFNQAREQTYTQYGYPAEEPYDGEVLYTHAAAYAGQDLAFSPPTMEIASDFTAGSSGGPWTVGDASPIALSVTDYGYEDEPGYLYGPYFGSLAQAVYEEAEAGVEPNSEESGASSAPGSSNNVSPTASTTTSSSLLRLVGIRHDRGSGTATLIVRVSGVGKLDLHGSQVRAVSKKTAAASTVGLTVSARGAATKALQRRGHASVGVSVTFSAEGKTQTRSRLIRLSRDR